MRIPDCTRRPSGDDHPASPTHPASADHPDQAAGPASPVGPDSPADPEEIARSLDEMVPEDHGQLWVRYYSSGSPGSPDYPSSRRIGDARPLGGSVGSGPVEVLFDLGELMGWVAPPTCEGMAVIADGVAHHIGEAGPASGVRVICVVDRHGRVAGRTRMAGATPVTNSAERDQRTVNQQIAEAPLLTDAPEGGRMLDAMLRCFELPTPPPAALSTEWFHRMWLGSVAQAAGDRAVALGWEQVRRLHPAVATLIRAGLPTTDEMIEAAIRLAAQAWSWEHIRLEAAEGLWEEDLISADIAEWMDDGMFSRWVLDETRTVDELLADLSGALSVDAERRLRRAVS